MTVSTLVQPVNASFDKTLSLGALAKAHGTPLLVLDIDQVRTNYTELSNALPGVTLHYALKPLPHHDVVIALNEMGAHFDLATSGEVDLVKAAHVAPEKVIHTHPVKRICDIEHALNYGCSTFVFDSENELRKFVPYKNDVELLLRLSFPNNHAAADLSKKFGVTVDAALPLLQLAHELGIRVRGISFHVGSQTKNAEQYVNAINKSLNVFHMAVSAGLPAMNTLDIGGGFPVSYDGEPVDIYAFCAPIRDALMHCPDTVHVIAEPGRFIVASCMTHVMSVMGQSKRGDKVWYYMDDGAYGSFSGRVYGEPKQHHKAMHEGQLQQCVLAGPTCDSIDVISECSLLPALEDGDLIFTENMGAYTWTTTTDFNFFAKAKLVVQDSAQAMLIDVG